MSITFLKKNIKVWGIVGDIYLYLHISLMARDLKRLRISASQLKKKNQFTQSRENDKQIHR